MVTENVKCEKKLFKVFANDTNLIFRYNTDIKKFQQEIKLPPVGIELPITS